MFLSHTCNMHTHVNSFYHLHVACMHVAHVHTYNVWKHWNGLYQPASRHSRLSGLRPPCLYIPSEKKKI